MPTTTITRTNTVRVLDCLQWHLERINASNGFATDGVTVDRSRDPRKVNQDIAAEFRASGTLVRIKMSDGEWLRGTRGVVGGVRRKQQQVELICAQELTQDQDEAGITVDMIQDWLRHDIEWGVLDADPNFLDAAEALRTADPDWGNAPSCINFQIDKYLAGPASTFPIVWQVFVCSYLYDEYSPGGTPGTP